jgi:Ca-activated chloride channel family protein
MKPLHLCPFVLAVAIALSATAAKPAGQEPQQPTFRARVDMVPVDVAVYRGGRPVGGLSKADFELFDNGVRQVIERADTDNVPLDAWLVLDVSSSLRGKPLVQLQEVAGAFVAALAPGDRVGLVTFSHEVLVPQPLTGDRSALRAALGQLQARGGTALYDATYVALQLRRPGDTRGVALVLTDGADNASWLTADRVLEAARRSDVLLYGIGVNEETPTPRITNEPFRLPETAVLPPAFADLPQYRFLRGLAGVSGGAVYDASFATLQATFAHVLADIRARYLLAFYPSNPTPGWHTIEVKVGDGRDEVTARRGYWIAPPRSGSN